MNVESRETTRPVAVVTDTTTYMPDALLDELGVHKVSLYVGWDGDLHPEHKYEDLDAFYARLRESARLPTTSQPSVGDFLACYRPLLESGRDVVSLHIAAGLSGTCASAHEAVEQLERDGYRDRVRVIDGETGAGGLGLLVHVAATRAAQGETLEQIAAAIPAARRELDIWFCLHTLEYLRKGGRIGAAQAAVGTALQIRPILTFGTEIAPVGRVRTHRRARERMVSHLRELHERGATDWIVQHAQSRDDAEWLVEAGRDVFGSPPLFCSEVGPVLGAHLGSGMLVGGMRRP